jgi:hypothetical protein
MFTLNCGVRRIFNSTSHHAHLKELTPSFLTRKHSSSPTPDTHLRHYGSPHDGADHVGDWDGVKGASMLTEWTKMCEEQIRVKTFFTATSNRANSHSSQIVIAASVANPRPRICQVTALRGLVSVQAVLYSQCIAHASKAPETYKLTDETCHCATFPFVARATFERRSSQCFRQSQHHCCFLRWVAN